MELKDIQSLIKLVSNSTVDEVLIEKTEFKLKIRKNGQSVIQTPVMAAPQPVAVETPVATPAASPAPTPAAEAPAAETSSNLIEVKSPMIGTFYRRPSPDKQNFVEVGDELQKGQVVCIIEAMKLFNEIESEVNGKVVKVLVDDSQPVEYDQPLFLVEPS
ncbi:MAG: acetyl-CoA carboxylase biotin carboxyl carrier protein [Bacteroidia bacterium]